MYKCLGCGHIFEKGEESVWLESRGECFGFQSHEKMQGCPLCGGDFQETKPCKICGSEHLEDELNENISRHMMAAIAGVPMGSIDFFNYV